MVHVPVGCLTLVEAFERFRAAKWGGHDPVSELQHTRYLGSSEGDWRRRSGALAKAQEWDRTRFVDAFFGLGGDNLEAHYLMPRTSERFRLPSAFWQSIPTDYRSLMTHMDFGDVSLRLLPSDSPYQGITPFVEEAMLDEWIDAYLAAQRLDNEPTGTPQKPPLWIAGFLLDLVKEGVLSREQAETHAKSWLLPSLSHSLVVPLSQISIGRFAPEQDNAVSFAFAEGRRPDPYPSLADHVDASLVVSDGPTFTTVDDRTGAPGRPSSMHLVENELDKRLASGARFVSVASAADQLHAWFKDAHINRQAPTAKTIKNRLASKIRQAIQAGG